MSWAPREFGGLYNPVGRRFELVENAGLWKGLLVWVVLAVAVALLVGLF